MPVVGGTATDGFPAVAALVDGDHVACSGVLIAPRLVVTAAHCAGADLAVAVGGGSDLRGASWSRVGLAWRHPRHDPATISDDLGLLVLDRDPPVAPIELADSIPPAGTELVVVGHGHGSAAGDDLHLRRAGTVLLVGVDEQALAVAAAPAGPCLGDSGGALVWMTGDGPRLLGIVTSGDASCASTARVERLDRHRDASITPLGAAAGPGTVGAGEWCVDDRSCAAGTCWMPADAPTRGYCAPACAGDDECAAGAHCDDGHCLLATPSPGALGAVCEQDIACDPGRCEASANDPVPRCTRRCFADSAASCPADHECAAAATPGLEICVARGGGCQAGADGGGAAVAVVLAWGILCARGGTRRRGRSQRAGR